MDGFLKRKFSGKLYEKNRTSRSLQFNFDKKIDVDMLVSPFWRDRHDLYRFLQGINPGKRSM